VNPWLRIHDRWFIPARPVAANHAALRLPEVPGLPEALGVPEPWGLSVVMILL